MTRAFFVDMPGLYPLPSREGQGRVYDKTLSLPFFKGEGVWSAGIQKRPKTPDSRLHGNDRAVTTMQYITGLKTS